MSNNLKQKTKSSKLFGFTLIEILVAMAIIITSTTIVVAILVSSFRGNSKANISEEVRQNGNSAITRMSRVLQFADSFQGASVNGSNYDPNCTNSGGIAYKYIKVTSNRQVKTLSCQDSSGNPDVLIIDSSGQSSFIDKTRVKINPTDSCKFTCLQDNTSVAPVIGISFSLSDAGGSVPEKKASISFSTSVRMRNL